MKGTIFRRSQEVHLFTLAGAGGPEVRLDVRGEVVRLGKKEIQEIVDQLRAAGLVKDPDRDPPLCHCWL